jgi:hypothetical protein
MPSKTFYLDDARSQPLTASWGMFFRNFTVSYAGTDLVPINPEASIAEGRQYRLPDGRVFSARHKKNSYPQEMELLLDGQPVAGSGTHPVERIKQAWYVLLFVGVLNLGLGLAAELGNVAVLLDLGLGWGGAAEGVIFLVAGWLGYSRRSVPALTTALVLLVLDAAMSIGGALASGHTAGLGGLVVRFYFCLTVFRGLQAARQLRREQAEAVATAF